MSLYSKADNGKFVEQVVQQGTDETKWAMVGDSILKLRPVSYKLEGTDVTVYEGYDRVIVSRDGEKSVVNSEIIDILDSTDPFGDGSLVAGYHFDGDATDYTGNGYDGTVNSGEFEAGIFNDAFISTSDDDWIEINDASSLKTNNITVSMWIKNDGSDDDNQLYFGTWYGDHWKGFNILHITNNNLTLYGGQTEGDIDIEILSGINIADNSWHHIVGMYSDNNKEAKLYLDGILIGHQTNIAGINYDSSNSDYIPDDSILIFGTKKSDYYGCNGSAIDQVQIFNRALTGDEVLALYNQQATKFQNPFGDQEPDFIIPGDLPQISYSLTEKTPLVGQDNCEVYRISVADGKINLPFTPIEGELLAIPGYSEDIPAQVDSNNNFDVSNIDFGFEPEFIVRKGGKIVEPLEADIDYAVVSGDYEAPVAIALDSNGNLVQVSSDVEIINQVDNPDPFGDGSLIAGYHLDSDATDYTGNGYDGTWKDSDGNEIEGVYDTGVFSDAAKFDKGNMINCGTINTNLDEIWISFWMKWNGTSEVMPVGFYKYDLYIYNEYFGWNTYNSDIYGIDFPNDTYANKWVHIVANFKTGEYGDLLYINGVKQEVSQKMNNIESVNAVIKDVNFYIGGWGNGSYFSFDGLIDQVQIFNRALTDDEVLALYNQQKVKYTFDALDQASSKLLLQASDYYPRVKEIAQDSDGNVSVTYEGKATSYTGTKLQRSIKLPKSGTTVVEPFVSNMYKAQD